MVAIATRFGSSDAAIRDPVINDLPGLMVTLSDLRAIAFNGATAWRQGTKQLGPRPGLTLVALPSSSPLHTIGLAAKRPAWIALGEVLRT